jgi:archaemetzincin
LKILRSICVRKAFLILTCFLILTGCRNAHKPRHAQSSYQIAILPFKGISEKKASMIASEIASFYHIKVKILPSKTCFEKARLAGSDRYDAKIILKELVKSIPEGCNKILAICNADIFTEKTVHQVRYDHWGIFGLGYQPGKACVVSDFRLKKFGKISDSLLVKVALHEMGHTFGLPHCNRDRRCMMNDAKGTVQTLFHEEKWLCAYCSGVIKNRAE